MSKLLRYLVSLRKSNGKKWSRIWFFLLKKWSKTFKGKKVFFLVFFFICLLCYNVQTFFIFKILGEKWWKEVVSDLKTLGHNPSKFCVWILPLAWLWKQLSIKQPLRVFDFRTPWDNFFGWCLASYVKFCFTQPNHKTITCLKWCSFRF